MIAYELYTFSARRPVVICPVITVVSQTLRQLQIQDDSHFKRNFRMGLTFQKE